MLECFNNPWVMVIAFFLLYAIYKKIINMNKPFDENRFIEQYKNQEKLKKNLTLDHVIKGLPNIASYYVGLN